MSTSQMCVEDRLAGANNWSPWRARIIFVLEDLKLWDIIEATMVVHPDTDPILLEDFRKRNNKEKRMICDSVRDHIIPHLTRKAWAYEMWESLCNLYQSSNENRNMVLHDQLRGIRMLEDESVTFFLGRYTQIKDEVGAVREVVEPNSMVRTTLNNFNKTWGPFIHGIISRSCPHGRGCGMTLFKRRLDLWQRLLDNISSKQCRVMRIMLSRQTERRRPSGEVGRVPSLWPHHGEERTVVDRRET
jgi:hypothetical protein